MKEQVNRIIKNLIKVRNINSSRGNEIPNQFIIESNTFKLFQSYNSPIALINYEDNKVYMFKNWDYSTTTGKYRNMFLGETKQETYKKLKSGEYIAIDFEVC